MKLKTYMSALTMVGITTLLLFTYNNCQPMGESMLVGGSSGPGPTTIPDPGTVRAPGEVAYNEKVLFQFQKSQALLS